MANGNNLPNLDESYSQENIAEVDQAIQSGELSEEDVPAHVQNEMAERGSQSFSLPEREEPQQKDQQNQEQQQRQQEEEEDRESTFFQEEPEEEDVILDERTNKSETNWKSNRGENARKLQAASIKALREGKSVTQAMGELLTENNSGPGENVAEREAVKYNREEAEAYRQQRQEVDVNQDPDDVVDEVQANADLEQESIENRRDHYRASIDSLASPEIQESQRKQSAADLRVNQMIQDTMEQTGGVEKTLDFLSMLEPISAAKDRYDLTGSFFDGREFIENFHANYMNASEKEKIKLLEGLEPRLEEVPYLEKIDFLQTLKDPLGAEEKSKEYHPAWAAFDAVDIAFAGAELAMVGKLLYKNSRITKQMKELGAEEDLSEANTVAMADESGRAQEILDMDEASLADTVSPFTTEHLNARSIDGVSTQTQVKLRQFERANREIVRQQQGDELFVREGAFTDSEADIIEQNLVDSLNQGSEVQNVKTSRNGNKINLTYDETLDDGTTVTRNEELQLDIDEDTMEWSISDPGKFKRHLTSNTVWAKGDFREVADQAQRLDSVQARVTNQLKGLHTEAMKTLLGKNAFSSVARTFSPSVKKKIEKVDNALLQGDKRGRTFTPQELRSGKLGVQLDEDEIEAYYKMRTLSDTLFELRNDEMRRSLLSKGHKNIDLNNRSLPMTGKPFDDATSAGNSINRTETRLIFDDEAGELRSIDEIDLAGEYDEGKILVRMDEFKDINDSGSDVRYILANSDNVSDLPFRVLNYRDGYIPKISDESAYFVKVSRSRSKEGVNQAANTRYSRGKAETVRAFDNKDDAEAFAEQQNKLLREQGISEEEEFYEALADRQIEKERSVSALNNEDAFIGGHGLYTGPRAAEEIGWGFDNTPRPRANAFESISRNIASTSKYITRNEWREGLEAKAVKTANRLRGGREFENFEDLASVAADTPNNRAIKAMYEQIRDWMQFPDTHELMFKETVQDLINGAIGKKLPGLKKGLHNIKSSDPIGAARAAAFHGLLGWFNPSQMWIQANGAMVALSLNMFNPADMGRMMQRQSAIQALQYVSKTDKNIAHVATSFGMDFDELKAMKNAWDRSGIQDAILTTADHAAAAKGQGVGMSALSKAADRGLFFYRAGELFNRRISFVTSYNRWKKRTGKRIIEGDRDIKEIMTETNNLMLNMGKAARASYQKGIWSLPTQFLQVNFRTLETLFGANGNLDGWDIGKVAAGQLALYGAAGIPLGGLGVNWLMEMTGQDQNDVERNYSAEQIKALNEGFIGWATLKAFNADVSVSDRSALLGQLDDFVNDLLFREGTTSEKLFGAFSTTGLRFWDNMLSEMEPISLGVAENRPIDVARTVMNPMLRSITSFRNADKAYMMHAFNTILDSNNNAISVDNFSASEEFAQLIGFTHSDVDRYWDTKTRLRIRESARRSTIKELTNIYYRYAVRSMRGNLTQEDIENFRNTVSLYMQSFPNSKEQESIRRGLQRRLTQGDGQIQKVWKEYRTTTGNGQVGALLDLKSGLTSGGVLRQGVFDNQEGEQ